MKFLLDENLSFRLCRLLADLPAEFVHVSAKSLLETDDSRLWNLARRDGFHIITKDRDFTEFAARFGTPPKVIRLQIGNATVRTTAHAIRNNFDEISTFCAAANDAVMIILNT